MALNFEDPAELSRQLSSLSRRSPDELSSYFEPFFSDSIVPGTRARVRCSTVALDSKNRPQVARLSRKLGEYVIDFAIPRSRIVEANLKYQETGSTHLLRRISSEADRLFSRLERSGEGGELLLYALAERLLGLPQVMCKMSLKTNSQMHVHGTDGLHAAISADTGGLALYWGESKLYSDVSKGIDACFSSLAPFLHSDGSSEAPAERDVQLLRENLDLADPSIEDALGAYLDPDSPLFSRVEYRAVCLVGFDEDAFVHLPVSRDRFVSAVRAGLERWRATVSGAISTHRLTSFELEMFCVPFPSVQAFRDAVRREILGDSAT